MLFCLLGPLEVRDGDDPVKLGEGRQRAVLALLLLHRNEAVTSDRLVDALWSEAPPPPTATKVLQNQVGLLRRALGDREGRRLQTHGHGYALHVEAGEVDVDRFERLVRVGTQALDDERAGEAADRLREALALWRGPPLADLSYEPFAQAEIARLQERRAVALARRIDADLALGRHADLVGELEAIVARDPLRERPRAQFMVALYRCGRQAEALEAYQDARRTLRDELGVEPGPELRELQRSILSHEPELGPAPRSWPLPPRARPAWIAAAGGALLLGAAIAAALLLSHQHGTAPRITAPRITADAVAALDPASGAVTAAVRVGASPSHLAADGRTLWVSNGDASSVSRVDMTGRAVRQTVTVGNGPAGLAVAGGSVWVADSLDGKVSRIDERTDQVTQHVPVGDDPTGVAAGAHAVWVANSGDETVSRIDPSTGLPTTIDVHAEPSGLAVGAGGVWITSAEAGTVSELDPRSGRVVQVTDVGGGAGAVAVADRSVWVANSFDGTVTRIDPVDGIPEATIPAGDGPDAIATSPGAVWVGERYGGTIERIDPGVGLGRVVHRIVVGHRPSALAFAGGRLWIGVRPAGTAHRGGTLRVLASVAGWDSIDPAIAYGTGSATFVGLTGDGLVALQHAPGLDGTQLVPDLALTLPRPQDGGRTYRFVLRRGPRYSTGAPVRAADVRPSFERLWKLAPYRTFTSPGPGFFGELVGGARCMRIPRSCDLRRGIVTAPADPRTVTFHLTRPDPDFLYKLTLSFAFVLPAGTPPRAADLRPLPATGPYAVAHYERNHLLELKRNPHFHEWSQAAQPDGYPDRIEVRIGGRANRHVDAVLDGRADEMGGIVSEVPAARVPELVTRYTAQTHSAPLLNVIAVFLNTRVAPFDDVRVRRALNLAIDRRAVVGAAGGATVATPTCQIVPPNMPGYERYCPYRAPDLRAARRLVAASRTRGMRVTVWSNPPFASSLRPAVAALRRLGYVARLRVVPDSARISYFGRANDSRTRAQAGLVYWGADYPAPLDFLDLLRCGSFQPASPNNLNDAEFCDPAIDRRIRAAAHTQVFDPQRAGHAWAAVDHALVDAAPWVPLYNDRSVALFSRRVGGYRYNPIHGVLQDQLWVR